MLIVPWRAAPVLAEIEKLTLSLPLPLEPDVIVIQDALLAARQGQLLLLLPALAATPTVPEAPLAAKFEVLSLVFSAFFLCVPPRLRG